VNRLRSTAFHSSQLLWTGFGAPWHPLLVAPLVPAFAVPMTTLVAMPVLSSGGHYLSIVGLASQHLRTRLVATPHDLAAPPGQVPQPLCAACSSVDSPLQHRLEPLAPAMDLDRDITGGHDSSQLCSSVQMSTSKNTSRRVGGDVRVVEGQGGGGKAPATRRATPTA
jgi:hypothetical protein